MDDIRINKYISLCGICSRRDADRMIADGIVTVNGVKAVPGIKVSDNDRVMVDGRPVRMITHKTVIAYYKPVGVTCTERDEHAERTVSREVLSDVRVTYAGRLDRDSEGLLIMTDDGSLIHEMMSAGKHHEKEYEVELNDKILKEDIIKMSSGIYLPELKITTRPCVISQTGSKSFNIILTQGVNRQIRRMCSACGYRVDRLCRTRIMNVKLAKMKPGDQRDITGAELEELYSECGLRGE